MSAENKSVKQRWINIGPESPHLAPRLPPQLASVRVFAKFADLVLLRVPRTRRTTRKSQLLVAGVDVDHKDTSTYRDHII